jgi:hypothetical protein
LWDCTWCVIGGVKRTEVLCCGENEYSSETTALSGILGSFDFTSTGRLEFKNRMSFQFWFSF